MPAPSSTMAVILAGGVGTRLGGELPKQLLLLCGRPMLDYSIAAAETATGIDHITIVMAADVVAAAADIVAAGGYRKVSRVIPGGASRSDSTRAALATLPPHVSRVVLHDAARPLVRPEAFDECVRALSKSRAVTLGVPSVDTLATVSNGRLVAHLDRASTWQVQTPQAFDRETLEAAHLRAAADRDFAPTDDCGVVMRYLTDVAVQVVQGSADNLKVTNRHDVDVAEALLRMRARA